jgi:subtilisin family serine protease
MLLHLLPAICASILGAVGCQQDQPTGVRAARAQADMAQARDTTLAPAADTYIRQVSPNQNQGAELILRLQSSGKNRALLRWDQQALIQAVAGGTVSAARLELTIADLGDNWSTTGRTIELHRMTQAWTELGATWNCAVDSAPGNSRADCTGATAWEMDPGGANPWVAAPTATAMLKNGQTGVVSFDVTADVAAWLAGQPNDGWILKKMVEGDPGKVDFGSRESAAPPRLLLTVAQSTSWPVLSAYPHLDASRLVHRAGDTSVVYFRTNIALRFKESVSDSAKRAFFARNSMTVVGVGGGQFFVGIPDPGPDLDSLYAAVDRLRAQPEVYVAVLIPFTPMRPARFSRYPTDGSTQARSDWLSGSSATWAMRAIRAPLAWGCETGLYGGPPQRVGVLEWKHARTHPEFALSSPQLREPNNPALDTFPKLPADTVAVDIAHAIATTGLLTAEGGNASGIAGVDWGTKLFMYAGNNASDQQLPLVTGFYVVAGLMAGDSIRVLSISVDAQYDASRRVEDRRQDILDLSSTVQVSLLDPLPSLLVVVAAGNERSRRSATDYYQDSLVGPLRAALLLLRADPKYRDRIIVAAGTEDGNRFWDTWTKNPKLGSSFFSNVTDIAAPALDVSVLGPWHGETGPSVPIAVETGTSLSAPLVAGVAAQLLAMDSTLTPAQVKDYILRGAQQKRVSSLTGDSVAPQPVSGAPETIYQLDAYGALTLLSRERPGMPICGFPVSVSLDSRSVVLERPRHPETLTLPTDTSSITSISVAQGGRLISAFMLYGSFGQGYSTVIDQRGTALTTVPNTQRIFLERETLDAPSPWLLGTDPVYTLRRSGGGTALEVRPWSRLPGPERDAWGLVAFSPSGDQTRSAPSDGQRYGAVDDADRLRGAAAAALDLLRSRRAWASGPPVESRLAAPARPDRRVVG